MYRFDGANVYVGDVLCEPFFDDVICTVDKGNVKLFVQYNGETAEIEDAKINFTKNIIYFPFTIIKGDNDESI